MRLPVFFLTLAVIIVECAATMLVSAQNLANKKNDQVLNYFNNLLPVANHTILHELGGPEIGAAVIPRLFSPSLKGILSDFFLLSLAGCRSYPHTRP